MSSAPITPPPEPTQPLSHAGYAVLEADGTIIGLGRNRWMADVVAARLPGRRIENVYIIEERSNANGN